MAQVSPNIPQIGYTTTGSPQKSLAASLSSAYALANEATFAATLPQKQIGLTVSGSQVSYLRFTDWQPNAPESKKSALPR
jgi:hypothetical protein